MAQLEMDCLLVKAEWIRGIFSGFKTMEVRSNCSYPLDVWVGLCESRTHIVYGAVKFSHSVRMKNDIEWRIFRNRHKVENDFSDVKYKRVYGWSISDVWRFVNPVRVEHKKGQVVWMHKPEIVKTFAGNERYKLLNQFYRECQEWAKVKHFI